MEQLQYSLVYRPSHLQVFLAIWWSLWSLKMMSVTDLASLELHGLYLTALQAFLLVEKAPFCQLLIYLYPSLTDKDISHRTKLREEILEWAKVVEESVKEKLQVHFIPFMLVLPQLWLIGCLAT